MIADSIDLLSVGVLVASPPCAACDVSNPVFVLELFLPSWFRPHELEPPVFFECWKPKFQSADAVIDSGPEKPRLRDIVSL